jgi:DNA-binding response OmpR family regulator
VLVIEDEWKLSALLCRALDASGYEAVSAGNGVQGLKLAKSGGFALVILDLLLPDIDGFTVLDQVMQKHPGQQVLVLSAITDLGSKIRCLEFGAVDFVSKPFELPELIARVRRRVRDGNGGGERFIAAGNLVLDLQRRSVRVGELEPVSLSTREFLVLKYIMRKEGEVCSRDELVKDVWGYSFDPGTNVVDVCIGRLRHKLTGTCIETIRNVGYCFVGA